MTSANYAATTIYTIRGVNSLRDFYKSGGSGEFTINQKWVTAKDILSKSQNDNFVFPLLFADAHSIANIVARAKITAISFSGRKSTIQFTDLQFLKTLFPISNLLKLDGTNLDENYRRGYAICKTPKQIANWRILSSNEIHNLEEKSFREGLRRTFQVSRYERQTKARNICIKLHGLKCAACEMTFSKRYGDKFSEFIHVHHLNELHKGERKTNPETDLVPVCPNCHAIIHLRKEPYSIKEVKEFIENSGHQNSPN